MRIGEVMNKKEKVKKPIFKRVWFWVLISPAVLLALLIVVGLSGGAEEGFEAGTAAAQQSTTQSIQAVATVTPMPTPTPTPKPTPTLNVSDAPYGVDINGNPGPGFIELVTYFEVGLEDITGKNVKISVREDDWEIGKANLNYILKTNCEIGDKKGHDVIMKINFDETYETYAVFQLKIDGKNIDY